MSLYKQSGSDIWFVDLSVRGQRIRRSTGTSIKSQAQEFHDRLKSDLWRVDKFNETPSKTWDDAVARYVTEMADKKSIEHDKAMLRFFSDRLRGVPLSHITRDTLEELMVLRREGRSSRTKNGTSNATINLHMEAVGRVLNKAESWGWVKSPPKIRRLTKTKGRLRFLSKEECERLMKVLPDHLKAMAEFSLATGLRENNVLELEWSQVDLERKVCWVHSDQSKTNKTIRVPLSQFAISVLERQKGIHETFVFPYNGKVMYKASTAAWYKAMKTAKIHGFTWHGLRHTWASWHVMKGTPLKVLQELGGWSSIETVMIYAHLSPGHVAQWADNVIVTP